jgi:putative acetyltransferase
VLIRPESATDRPAVQALIATAFAPDQPTGRPVVEAVLNDALRLDPAFLPELTLVAELAGEIVGQVTSSYGVLVDPDGGQRPMVGVGPLSVLPRRQGQGIGSRLMLALIDAADRAGEPALVLLGSPDFYGRFGFVAATDVRIEAPDPAWGRYFQVRTLTSFDRATIGAYRYSAPFDSL